MRSPFRRRPQNTYTTVDISNEFVTHAPVRIEPGDVVFIESERRIPRDLLRKVQTQFEQQLPDNRIVVLEAGLKLAGSAGHVEQEFSTPR